MGWPAAVLISALAQDAGKADPPWQPCIARVVDGATHQAIAGVDVYWLDRDELSKDDRRLIRDRELVPEEWIRRLGHHATSDATGDVALPRDRNCRVAVAWHDGKFARFDTDWGLDRSHVYPLELEDDTSQIVRVVDAAGAPLAGVEVAAWCSEVGICLNCGPSDDHIWSEPTDAKGEVRLPHADWFFHSDGGQGNLSGRVHLVGLGFPVREPNWVGSEARKGDPPAIELVAPPLESLELEFQLESGERCKSPVWATLAPLAEARDPDSSYGTGRPFGSWLARDGRLSLRSVERGLPLFVPFACDPASGSTWNDVSVPSRVPGASDAPRQLRANEHRVMIHGRAIERNGQPWRNARIALELTAPELVATDPRQDALSLELSNNVAICDFDGRFSCSLPPMESSADPKVLEFPWLVALTIDDGAYFPVVGPPTRISVRDAPETRASGIDVGDVLLAPPELSVAGRVVDGAGRPLRGVFLNAQDAPPRQKIRASASVSATTNDDGRFAIHGEKFEEALYFAIWEPGWSLSRVRTHPGGPLEPAETRVPPGSSEVELVLEERPGVRGRILFADGMRARDLALGLDTAGPAERLDFYPDGSFEAHVESDVALVLVKSASSGEILAKRGALVPESGLLDDTDFVIDLRPPSKGK
jgi:hypothetical protein